jgi:5'-nucleotidase
MTMRPRLLALTLAVIGLAAMGVAAPSGASPRHRGHRPRTVQVQILGINDFHGHLQPNTPGCITIPGSTATTPACRNNPGQVPAGGAAFLATHLAQLRATNRHTIQVAAGDNVGASPLASALFHDEPTIEALNLMGLDLSAPGNHEFDEGLAELQRLQRGGCHPVDGCFPQPDGSSSFAGADFPFVAANITFKDSGRLVFPPFVVRRVGGVKIGFIGIDLKDTPTIVTPSGVAGVDFGDESDAVNKWSRILSRFGVKAQVVMIHDGSAQAVPGSINDCGGGLVPGGFVDEVNQMSSRVDLVMSGHTHQPYICDVGTKKVVSGSSFGRVITDVDLTISRRTHDVVDIAARNVPVTQDVTPDPQVAALVDHFVALAAPKANRVVGSITADITTTTNAAGEQAMGDVIADSQLMATTDTGDAQIAFMNPGGVRAPLTFANSTGGEAPGQVTFSEIFTVQPFGNSLVTMTLTGAQIDTLLEQQWINQPFPRIMLPSANFAYTWSQSAPVGSRVDPASIRISGVPVDPTATYRVTVNSFMAEGGDNFVVLRDGTARVGGAVDLDALEGYFAAVGSVSPPALGRITTIG